MRDFQSSEISRRLSEARTWRFQMVGSLPQIETLANGPKKFKQLRSDPIHLLQNDLASSAFKLSGGLDSSDIKSAAKTPSARAISRTSRKLVGPFFSAVRIDLTSQFAKEASAVCESPARRLSFRIRWPSTAKPRNLQNHGQMETGVSFAIPNHVIRKTWPTAGPEKTWNFDETVVRSSL